MKRFLFYVLPLLSLILLSACQSTHNKPVTAQDGPPIGNIADLSSVPEPVPQAEAYSKYGNPASYQALGKRYKVWDSHLGYKEEGVASWYGTKFHGKRTSSGEPYDMFAMTAAHKNLPIPSYVRVTNLDNHKSIVVRVNDRGPFKENRIIDLSYAAAAKIGILNMGTGRVKVEAIDATHSTLAQNATTQNSNMAHTLTKSSDSPLYVQVAAFSNRDNANALVSKLTSHTNKAVQVKADKSLYRVHVGPFHSLSEVNAFKGAIANLQLGTGLIVLK